MTLREYGIYMTAYRLKKLDKEYFIHLQAFKNQQVQATKKNRKPYYKDFNEFFPYQKQENEILGITTKRNKRDTKILDMMKRANA